MHTIEARVPTANAQRYLAQLCRHATAMGERGGHMRLARHVRHGAGESLHGQVRIEAQWTQREGTIRFEPYGVCVLAAGEGELVVRIEAVEEDKLARIQQILTADLERFGGRREKLAVQWRPAEGATGAAKTETEAEAV